MAQGGRTYTPEKKFHYVYMLTIMTEDGEKYYIGKRSCNCPIEKDTYTGSGTVLKKAIAKYGKAALYRRILEVCETEEEVFTREKYYIDLWDAVRKPIFYNLAYGGHGEKRAEGRKKQSEQLRDKMVIPDHQKKILSEIHKRPIICINTKQTYSCMEEAEKEFVGATRGHITQCCRGQRLYAGTHPETGEKLMWAYLDKNGEFDYPEAPEYHRKNVRGYNYICKSTGRIYNNIVIASQDTGCNRNSIRDCCQGKQKYCFNKDNEKLEWEYGDYQEVSRANNKKVYCIELDQVFDSLALAAIQVGSTKQGIGYSCKKNGKTYSKRDEKYYHWQFVESAN